MTLILTFDHMTWKLLSGGIRCIKFSNFQVNGSKYTERTTSSLILTFDHVTWKSIGVIYLLKASTVPSLVTLKQSWAKTDRRPTIDMPPFFKGRGGGLKNITDYHFWLMFSIRLLFKFLIPPFLLNYPYDDKFFC